MLAEDQQFLNLLELADNTIAPLLAIETRSEEELLVKGGYLREFLLWLDLGAQIQFYSEDASEVFKHSFEHLLTPPTNEELQTEAVHPIDPLRKSFSKVEQLFSPATQYALNSIRSAREVTRARIAVTDPDLYAFSVALASTSQFAQSIAGRAFTASVRGTVVRLEGWRTLTNQEIQVELLPLLITGNHKGANELTNACAGFFLALEQMLLFRELDNFADQALMREIRRLRNWCFAFREDDATKDRFVWVASTIGDVASQEEIGSLTGPFPAFAEELVDDWIKKSGGEMVATA